MKTFELNRFFEPLTDICSGFNHKLTSFGSVSQKTRLILCHFDSKCILIYDLRWKTRLEIVFVQCKQLISLQFIPLMLFLGS